MTYRRHGRVRPELVRRLEGVRTDRAASVAFAVCSAEAAEGLSVSFEGAGGARTSAALEGGLPAGQWREFAVSLPGSPLAAVTWAEAGPPQAEANTLFVGALRLLDAAGGVVFEEDFERDGWQCPAGPQPAVAAGGAEGDGHALKVPAGAAGVRKDLSGYDLAGTELLRCRLFSPSRRPATVELAVQWPGGEAVQAVNLPGGRWQTVQLSRQAAGISRADWAGLSAVELRPADAPEGVLVDDVSFRCPPRVVRYTFVTFLHCAAPALAALAVILVGLKLLRFEEMDYVVRWVRERGWRRRQRSEEAGADVGP